MRRFAPLVGLVVALVTVPAAAELTLPPGFTAQVYVTGQGFDTSSDRGVFGIPAIGTLAFDGLGTLYLAKTGTRFRSGEVEDFSTIFRIPAGGARLTPDTEARYHSGPPLRNPQIAAARGRGEVFVTTYDRDRKIGALYRMVDGRPQLLAGGTPLGGAAPLLRHPEGVTFDTTGHIYVTDREQGVVVRLDRSGKTVSEPPRSRSCGRARSPPTRRGTSGSRPTGPRRRPGRTAPASSGARRPTAPSRSS